jgi:hypothetical protein
MLFQFIIVFYSSPQHNVFLVQPLNSRIYKIHHIYARKNRQVITDLQTSCYHLVIMLTMVTDLLQVVPTRLIQAVSNQLLYKRKNLTSCSKSANKPSTSCVRTACPKLSTSLEQAVNNLK